MTKKSKVWAALACTLLLALGMGTAALADTQGTQTVTTSVPEQPPAAPSWMLNIPANVFIPYGETESSIGVVTVSDVENVPDNRGIFLYASSTEFESASDAIDLTLVVDHFEDDTKVRDHEEPRLDRPLDLYRGDDPGAKLRSEFLVLVDSDEWDAAAPGEYEATVTYTSELLAKD